MSLDLPLILETTQLSKSFGSVTAVNEVNLQIYEGDVYALLGPNGAGKTTTLSLITGLLHPTNGNIWFAGRPGEMAGFLGVPPIYPHLSGRENLQLSYYARKLAVDHRQIDKVLHKVGLAEAQNRQTGQYSTGMRQRLGIARALLFKARLIILDEPTNGLDPEGIIEVRELIRQLQHDNQTTILLSSHLLGEVEQVATRVGIIANGRLQFETDLASLQSRQNRFEIQTDQPERARAALAPLATLEEMRGERLVILPADGTCAADLNRHLVEQGIPIKQLKQAGNHLEDVYLQICHGIIPCS